MEQPIVSVLDIEITGIVLCAQVSLQMQTSLALRGQHKAKNG